MSTKFDKDDFLLFLNECKRSDDEELYPNEETTELEAINRVMGLVKTHSFEELKNSKDNKVTHYLSWYLDELDDSSINF